MRNEGGVFFSSGQSEASASDPEVQADRKNNGTQGRDKDRGAGANSNHLHFQQPLRFSVPSNRNDKGISLFLKQVIVKFLSRYLGDVAI